MRSRSNFFCPNIGKPTAILITVESWRTEKKTPKKEQNRHNFRIESLNQKCFFKMPNTLFFFLFACCVYWTVNKWFYKLQWSGNWKPFKRNPFETCGELRLRVDSVYLCKKNIQNGRKQAHSKAVDGENMSGFGESENQRGRSGKFCVFVTEMRGLSI